MNIRSLYKKELSDDIGYVRRFDIARHILANAPKEFLIKNFNDTDPDRIIQNTDLFRLRNLVEAHSIYLTAFRIVYPEKVTLN